MGSGFTTAKPATSQSFSKPVTEKRKKSTEITNSTHGISESNNSRSKKTMSQLSRAGTLSSPHHVDNIDASRDIDGGGKSTSQMIEKPGVYKSTISVKSSSQRAQTDRQKITTDSSSSTKRPKTKAVFEIIKRFEATSLQETEIMMAWLDEKLKHLDTKVQSDDRNLKPDAGVNGNEEGETQNIDVDWKKMRKDITGYKSEKQRLLNVISEIAGNRLKSNNPAIADLSDKNRASKLAEKFSELYDNEWTDVVEVLRTIKSNNSVQEDELERKSISYMVDVIKISYQMCQKKAKKDLDKMIKVVVKSSDASADAAKRCKDFMKTQMSSGEKSLDTVVEAVTKEVENDMRENEYYKEYNQKLKDDLYYKRYLHSCVELCWLMRLQDPPVFMMATIVAESTKDHFRAYTRSGKHFDFIVWPALFLYKDGPLLYKGVAQYTDKSKDSFDF